MNETKPIMPLNKALHILTDTTELATNDVMLATKDFDQTTSEGVQFHIAKPKSWDEGTVTFIPYWTAAVRPCGE